MALFSAEAMVEVTMSTGISGLLLSARNYHASMKMAADPTLAVAVVRGEAIVGHVPLEDISLLSLSNAGAARSLVE